MIWSYEADDYLVRNLYRLAGALKDSCVGKPRAPVPSSTYPNNHIGAVRSRTTSPSFLLDHSAQDSTLFLSIRRKTFPTIRSLYFRFLQAKIAGGKFSRVPLSKAGLPALLG